MENVKLDLEADFREIGRQLLRGVVDELFRLFIIFAVAFFIISFIAPIDDSDKDWAHRSGFKILTDYKTGKQYLSDGKGGLVVREATDERH